MRLLLLATMATMSVQALVGTTLAQQNRVGRIPPPIDRDYGRQQTLVINMHDQVFVDRGGRNDDWVHGGIGRDDRGGGRGGIGSEFDNDGVRGGLDRDRTGIGGGIGRDDGRGGGVIGGIDRDGGRLGREGRDDRRDDRTDRGGGRIDNDRRGSSGRNEILLKQLIVQTYPTINVHDLELIDVKLIAKSANGRGLAELEIDSRVEDRSNVGLYLGRVARNEREAFEYGGPLTYDQVLLTPLRLSALSRTWQIDLSGTIKVHSIEITVKNSGGRHEPGGPGRDPYDRVRNVHIGTMMPQRAYADVRSFNVYERDVLEVSLEGLRGEAHIESVEVQYRRGLSEMLFSLTGTLGERQVKTARLRNGDEVVAIVVRAQGSRYVYANSEIGVSVGAMR
jgi:hypothetical protein